MYANDNVCRFFLKMGACRNGDTCGMVHMRPPVSQTVLFPMMYPNPQAVEVLNDPQLNVNYDKKFTKKHFEKFYKEIWRTFMTLGRIAELRVVSNLGEHLLGNVYIRFEDTNDAAAVVKKLGSTRFNDIILLPELSPVVDFANGCCKEDAQGVCSRGGACNYLHIIKISKSVIEKLENEQTKYYKKEEKKRARSASPKKRDRTPPPAPGDVCHICGKRGHISRDCPLKP